MTISNVLAGVLQSFEVQDYEPWVKKSLDAVSREELALASVSASCLVAAT